MNIKMTFKLLLLASLIATAGCIKQKNCDCGSTEAFDYGMTGTFVYLKEPYYLEVNCSVEKREIVAHFFENHIIHDYPMLITGNVPKKFQTYDTIRVNICRKYLCKLSSTFEASAYKLTCIEMED